MTTPKQSTVIYSQSFTDLDVVTLIVEVFENEGLLTLSERKGLINQFTTVYNYFKEVYGPHLVTIYNGIHDKDEIYLEDLEWMFKDGYDVNRIVHDLRQLVY